MVDNFQFLTRAKTGEAAVKLAETRKIRYLLGSVENFKDEHRFSFSVQCLLHAYKRFIQLILFHFLVAIVWSIFPSP